MQANKRREYILDRLFEKGIIHVKEIADELGLHETTIRRDLESLEVEGKLTRVYGGALPKEDDSAELTMSQKIIHNYDIKRSICKYASELVKDGDSVFMDGGTTTAPFVEFLLDRPIQIVTHSDLIIRKIKTSQAQIVTLGGKYLPHYSMSVGATTVREVSAFHFDYCFIGCLGVDTENNITYTSEQESLDVKKAAMNNSNQKILLIDSSKLNVRGFCKFSELDAFDKILCNQFEDYPESLTNLKLV